MINSWQKISLLILLISVTAIANAMSVEELVTNKKLSVSIKVQSKGTLVVKQPVIISIEILTDRWFAGGSRIHDFNVRNIVKLPLNGQAINGNVRKDGKQWTSQIREITLFPMEAGEYLLPPITLDVAVNTISGTVKGQIQTKTILLDVELPQELQLIENFVVTEHFELAVDGEFDAEQEYKIGEAVTITFEFSADGLPAMILPILPEFSIPGVSIYRKKPVMTEKNNRGELFSRRKEQLNFIFEQQGQYQIPELTFYWWNLTTQTLETVSYPAQTWRVSGDVLSTHINTIASVVSKLQSLNWWQLLAWFCAMYLILGVLIKAYKSRHRLFYEYRMRTQFEQRLLKKNYMNAVNNQQYSLACQHLYNLMPYLASPQKLANNNSIQWALHDFYGTTPEKQKVIQQLLVLAFSGKGGNIDLSNAVKILVKDHSKNRRKKLIDVNRKIELNPK